VNSVFIDHGESAEKVSAWLQTRQLPVRNVLIDGKRVPRSINAALQRTLFVAGMPLGTDQAQQQLRPDYLRNLHLQAAGAECHRR